MHMYTIRRPIHLLALIKIRSCSNICLPHFCYFCHVFHNFPVPCVYMYITCCIFTHFAKNFIHACIYILTFAFCYTTHILVAPCLLIRALLMLHTAPMLAHPFPPTHISPPMDYDSTIASLTNWQYFPRLTANQS